MEPTHGHEDWVGNDHLTKEHEETLGNGTRIKVNVRQTAADEYLIEMWVLDGGGAELYHETKRKAQDPGPAAELLKWGIDQAKRHAAGHRGAPLDDHHQKTPI